MHSVFISHSLADEDFVRRLSNDLKAQGYYARSFTDLVARGESLSRTELDERLGGAIETDTFFVPVLTQSAVRSHWIDKELAAAIQAESKMNQVKVVPVLSEPCVLPHRLNWKCCKPDQ